VEVLPGRVSVLAEVAESPDQIDAEQARDQHRRAEQLLSSRDQDTDYAQALLDLRAAEVRLEVVEKE
jgi:F-type H+-transporting ATPase subunit epsilon